MANVSYAHWSLITGSLVAMVLVGVITTVHSDLLVEFLSLLALGLISLKYPEVLLGLFIWSGFYKKASVLTEIKLPILKLHVDVTVLTGILVLLWIAYAYFGRRNIFPRLPRSFIIPLAVIATLALGSLTYTPSLVYGPEKALRFLSLGLLAAVAPLFFLRSRRSLILFFLVSSVISLVAVTDSILSEERGAFGDVYTVVGKLGGLHVLLVYFYFRRTTSNFLRIVTLASAIYALAGLLHSATRASLLALVASLVLAVLLQDRKSSTGWDRIVPTVLLVCVPIMFALFPAITSTMSWRLAVIQDNPRIDIWRASIDEIVTNPLFGGGIGSFYQYLELYRSLDTEAVFSHNVLLELWAELGLFAAVSFVYLFLSLLLSIYRVRKKLAAYARQDYLLFDTLFVILLYVSMHTLVGGVLYDRFIFGWLGIGFAALNMVNSHDEGLKKQTPSSAS